MTRGKWPDRAIGSQSGPCDHEACTPAARSLMGKPEDEEGAEVDEGAELYEGDSAYQDDSAFQDDSAYQGERDTDRRRFPTDLPTDLPTELPTDLPTELPTDLPTELRARRGGPPDEQLALLRTADVAALFQVSTRTVSEWARRDRMPRLRTPGGQWRFPAGPIFRLWIRLQDGDERERGS